MINMKGGQGIWNCKFVLRRPTHIGLSTMREPTFEVMDTIVDPSHA
jgi:hypothetical protein